MMLCSTPQHCHIEGCEQPLILYPCMARCDRPFSDCRIRRLGLSVVIPIYPDGVKSRGLDTAGCSRVAAKTKPQHQVWSNQTAGSSSVAACGAEGAGNWPVPVVKPAAVKQEPNDGSLVHVSENGGGFTYPTFEMCEQRFVLLKAQLRQFPRPDGANITWHVCAEREMD
jgi:hypothetical protein